MYDKKSSKLLLFNGEIYEPTRDDTPDSLLLFQEFYNDNLNSFLENSQGEFAISAIDLRKKTLSLFLDLIGTKPLSYAIQDGKIGLSTYDCALEHLGFQSIIKVSPNKKIQIKFADLNKPELRCEDR